MTQYTKKVSFICLTLLLSASGTRLSNSARRKQLRHHAGNNPPDQKQEDFYGKYDEEVLVPILPDGSSSSSTSAYKMSSGRKIHGKKSKEKSRKKSSQKILTPVAPLNQGSFFGKSDKNKQTYHDTQHVDYSSSSHYSSKKKAKKSKKKAKKKSKKSKPSSTSSFKKSQKHSKKSKKHKISEDKIPEDDIEIPCPSQSPSSVPTSGIFPTRAPAASLQPTTDSGGDRPTSRPSITRTPTVFSPGSPTVFPTNTRPGFPTRMPTILGSASPMTETTITRTGSPTITPIVTRTGSPTRASTLMPTVTPTTTEIDPPTALTSTPSAVPSYVPSSLISESLQPSTSSPSSEESSTAPTTDSFLNPPSISPSSVSSLDNRTSAPTTSSTMASDAPSAIPTIDSTLSNGTAAPTISSTLLSDAPSALPTGSSLTNNETAAPTTSSTTLSDVPSLLPSVVSSTENGTEAPTSDSTTLSDAPSLVPTIDSTFEGRTTAPTGNSTALSDVPSSVPTSSSSSDAPSALPTASGNTNSTAAPSSTDASTNLEDPFVTTLNLDEVPENYRQVFIDAASIWDSVIAGDLEDYVVREADLQNPGLRCDPASIPEVIDDVFICASLPEIDGPGGIIGTAGPTFARKGDFVQTSLGSMRFDIADIELLDINGQLPGTILHEMAHVYGIGTLWSENLLVEDTDSCPYQYDSRASEEYRALSGCDAAVPVETDGSDGTKCLHWSEDCFQSELMTGVKTGGLELSRISIASLEDMGYEVDYSQASPFPADLLSPSCVCNVNANIMKRNAPIRRGSSSSAASDEARQKAINYGLASLRSARTATTNETDTDRIYMGDKVIVVLYWSDEHVQSVLVKADT